MCPWLAWHSWYGAHRHFWTPTHPVCFVGVVAADLTCEGVHGMCVCAVLGCLRQLSTCSAVHGLLSRLGGVSAMGAYECPMDVLNVLISCKPAARTLVKLPAWLPPITRCSIIVGAGFPDDTSQMFWCHLFEQC